MSEPYFPGLTASDQCPDCGGDYFWGVVRHDDGCPSGHLYAHPSDLANRDQMMAMMRDFLDAPTNSHDRRAP